MSEIGSYVSPTINPYPFGTTIFTGNKGKEKKKVSKAQKKKEKKKKGITGSHAREPCINMQLYKERGFYFILLIFSNGIDLFPLHQL